jgi:hypothetical protein
MSNIYEYSKENSLPQNIQEFLNNENINNFLEVAEHIDPICEGDVGKISTIVTSAIVDQVIQEILIGKHSKYINQIISSKFQKTFLANVKRTITRAITKSFASNSINHNPKSNLEAQIHTESSKKRLVDNFETHKDFNEKTSENQSKQIGFKCVLRGFNDAVDTNIHTQNNQLLQLKDVNDEEFDIKAIDFDKMQLKVVENFINSENFQEISEKYNSGEIFGKNNKKYSINLEKECVMNSSKGGNDDSKIFKKELNKLTKEEKIEKVKEFLLEDNIMIDSSNYGMVDNILSKYENFNEVDERDDTIWDKSKQTVKSYCVYSEKEFAAGSQIYKKFIHSLQTGEMSDEISRYFNKKMKRYTTKNCAEKLKNEKKLEGKVEKIGLEKKIDEDKLKLEVFKKIDEKVPLDDGVLKKVNEIFEGSGGG